jgi:acyl-CoA synthetase (AMP-forming)/AMP-acid ligase II
VLSVTAPVGATVDVDRLLAECRRRLPAYMVPADIDVHATSLPRNPNGKIDRKTLATRYAEQRGAQP